MQLLCFQLGFKGRIEIAAGDDGDNAIGRRQLVEVKERGRERYGAGRLGDDVRGGKDQACGDADLVFGDGKNPINEVQDVGEV